MKELNELVELAKKATPGRNYDRLDCAGGGIKYQCLGDDGSLVLQCDHKNDEYGFIGPKSLEDEAFFLACKPQTILAIAEAFSARCSRALNAEGQLEADGDMVLDAQESMREWRLRAEAAEAKLAELVPDEMYGCVASLAAAVSLLENGGKKAAGSDKMFYQMLEDYKKSLDAGRAILRNIEEAK